MSEQTRCGYVALIGRPNVGKSTLINHLLGEKISITSKKPQTTRHRILGILTEQNMQIVFMDTPGIHRSEGKAINRYMNRAALTALNDVDAIVLMVEALQWTEQDDYILKKISSSKAPVILAINKVDNIRDKALLLPFIEQVNNHYDFNAIIPLAAATGDNVPQLLATINPLMPQSPFFFAEDTLTDKSIKFMVAELIREKIFRLTGQELPYTTTVAIEQFELKDKIQHIAALILVERQGQKRIIIGKSGEKLKAIGSAARINIESLLGTKVYLQLWVKVKKNWSDDDKTLASLGYNE